MAAQKRQNTGQNNGLNPSPEMVKEFLSVQSKELQVRAQELTVQSENQHNHKEIAKLSIEANKQDRKDEREYKLKRTQFNWIGGGIVLVIVLIFAGYALFLGKEELILEVVKYFGTFAAGFVGGYGISRGRAAKDSDEDIPQS